MTIAGRLRKFGTDVVVGKWGVYWKGLLRDYALVAREIGNESRRRPTKAAVVSAGVGGAIASIFVKPNEHDFRDELLNWTSELMLVGNEIQNPASLSHLTFLERSSNAGLLRYQSLGVCTLVWLADHSPECALFEAQCKYLKPDWLTFFAERVVDVGFWNRWWMLERKMIDYDVNPDEWPAVEGTTTTTGTTEEGAPVKPAKRVAIVI